jgi:hypothetical protein
MTIVDDDGRVYSEKQAIRLAKKVLKGSFEGDSDFDKGMRELQKLTKKGK